MPQQAMFMSMSSVLLAYLYVSELECVISVL